eukprot:5742227-Prymnesium_polylepis.1
MDSPQKRRKRGERCVCVTGRRDEARGRGTRRGRRDVARGTRTGAGHASVMASVCTGGHKGVTRGSQR